MRRTVFTTLFIIALGLLATPALAGGWATVRLDQPPGEIPVGTPWRIGFTVLQHDVTPNSDVTPVIQAINKATGEVVTATARQDGPVGHFVAELTLPASGEWKWEITPEPYAGTSFESLRVVDSSTATSALRHPAEIVAGDCASPGEVSFALGDVAAEQPARRSTALPVGFGQATIEAPLAELLAGKHAIRIAERAPASESLACGDLTGTIDGGQLLIGLQPVSGTHVAGIAVLRDQGDTTAVMLYLMTIGNGSGAQAASDLRATVEIVDGYAFQPFSLEVAPGTTVTWINASRVAHTVMSDDLAFDDSGPIDPHGRFSATFELPGTYHYRCGPHPGMEGIIVVK
jgi:plastocyanin